MPFRRELNILYRNLLDASKGWENLTPRTQRAYEKDLRIALNDLTRFSVNEVSQADNIYNAKYNELVDQYKNKVSFNIERATGDHRKLARIQKEATEAITSGSKSTLAANKLKRDFYYNAIEAIELEDVDKFKPRITLLEVGTIQQKQAQRLFINTINKTLDGTITRRQAESQIIKKLNQFYPDGSIIYRDRNGKRRTLRNDSYSEMWINDIQNISNNEAVLSYAKQAHFDLIRVTGGTTQNFCDEFSSPPSNIYSISGKNPNYPQLSAWPPYHPNCSKGTDIAQENFSQENLELNDQIYQEQTARVRTRQAKQASTSIQTDTKKKGRR